MSSQRGSPPSSLSSGDSRCAGWSFRGHHRSHDDEGLVVIYRRRFVGMHSHHRDCDSDGLARFALMQTTRRSATERSESSRSSRRLMSRMVMLRPLLLPTHGRASAQNRRSWRRPPAAHPACRAEGRGLHHGQSCAIAPVIPARGSSGGGSRGSAAQGQCCRRPAIRLPGLLSSPRHQAISEARHWRRGVTNPWRLFKGRSSFALLFQRRRRLPDPLSRLPCAWPPGLTPRLSVRGDVISTNCISQRRLQPRHRKPTDGGQRQCDRP